MVGSEDFSMNYRNRALLDLARLAPHCMGCWSTNHGDVVSAHSNQGRDGKGMGIKAHDYRIAMICGECHHEIDQGGWTQEQKVRAWEKAHRATIGWLFEAGHLVLADSPVTQERAPKPIVRKVRKSRPIANRGFPAGKRPFR